MKTSEATSTRTPVSIKIMSGHASADMKMIAIMMIDINRHAVVAERNVIIQRDGPADKMAVISTIIMTDAAEEEEPEYRHHKNNRNAGNRSKLLSKEPQLWLEHQQMPVSQILWTLMKHFLSCQGKMEGPWRPRVNLPGEANLMVWRMVLLF